jgi:hypothetical protein
MSMKTLVDRRMLLFWVGVAFIGCTLAVSELGCGQMAQSLGIQDQPAASLAKASLGNGELEQYFLHSQWDLDNPGPHVLCQETRALDTQAVAMRGFYNVNATAEPEKAKPGNAPSVWKRDRRRPTFARVYVGDGNSLELVSIRVSVVVHGPRARTTVDHIFRNPHDKQLEGTFEYPLPTGASPSYFAMFTGQSRDTPPPRFSPKAKVNDDELSKMKPEMLVKNVDNDDWGKLQKGRIVAKDKALETYEDTVRAKIDPALLEYAGGNTFSGRVFPIPSKGYNRVILAYEETLPCSGEEMIYRYPMPDCKLEGMQLTVDAHALCDSYELGKDRRRVMYTNTLRSERWEFKREWTNNVPKGDAVFRFPCEAVQTIAGRQGENGPQYVYTRIRPKLEAKEAKPFAQHAVFLLDTSLSEHPDRFNVSMNLMKHILEGDPDIKQFNVLTFDVGARWLETGGWLDNNGAGREAVSSRLNGVLLEGATDVGAALDKLCKPSFAVEPGTPLNVFLLSDGQITWGESDVAQLVAKFESRCPFPTRFHCYRTGLGADNAELFEALTRRGGGVFNCFGESDLSAAAQAHRHQCWQIERVSFNSPPGGQRLTDVLVAGRKTAVYPGGDLIVTAQLPILKPLGKVTLIVEGTYLGQKKVEEYPIDVNGSSELAARAWGEVAVASLLSANDPKLDSLVTAYCQQFSIGSKVASFLVLENEKDYKRLNLEEERGKTVSGDLGSFLDGLWVNLGKPLSERAVFERFLTKTADKVKLFDGDDGKHVKKLLALLEDADFELPAGDTDSPLLHNEDVSKEYIKARKKEPRNVNTYIEEALNRYGFRFDRHAERKDALAGAPGNDLRALSCIAEMYPGRADALRLVGYRLLDMKQAPQAARLFRQVERNRPFEPHSYRDLARSLQESGKYGLAALQYEIVLAGTWHSRFHDSLKVVAREEYVQMMQQAVRDKAVSPKVADLFGERLEGLKAAREPNDLRVTISWNTDATDVDLWVIEPDGEKVFYSHKTSKHGGELSEDQTQGYGPERYRIAKAQAGEYKVIVHNFNPNPNLLGGETHVQVVVTHNAGTPRETSQRYNVILKTAKEEVEVTREKF